MGDIWVFVLPGGGTGEGGVERLKLDKGLKFKLVKGLKLKLVKGREFLWVNW